MPPCPSREAAVGGVWAFPGTGRTVTPPGRKEPPLPPFPGDGLSAKSKYSSKGYIARTLFIQKADFSELFTKARSWVENKAGERLGVMPPSQGTVSGSARPLLGEVTDKSPINKYIFRKFGCGSEKAVRCHVRGHRIGFP